VISAFDASPSLRCRIPKKIFMPPEEDEEELPREAGAFATALLLAKCAAWPPLDELPDPWTLEHHASWLLEEPRPRDLEEELLDQCGLEPARFPCLARFLRHECL